MYHPGGAKFLLLVSVTVRLLPEAELIVKSTSRCSVSQEWVVALGLTKLAHLMFEAWGVVIVIC
jgi:hypothetical protein